MPGPPKRCDVHFCFFFMLTPSVAEDEQVFFEAGRKAAGPTFTLGIDPEGTLFFRVCSRDGQFCQIEANATPWLGQPIVLSAEVGGDRTTSDGVHLELRVEGDCVASSRFAAPLEGTVALRSVVGRDLSGRRPAHFSVTALRPVDHRQRFTGYA
jgi:hypothetical protein